jgi:hypothetical protein
MKLTQGSKSNAVIYLLFLLIAVIGMYYGRSISGSHSFLRVWDWTTLFILLAGFPFCFLQTDSRLLDFLNEKVSAYNRFSLPVLIGVVFGVLDVVVIKLIMHPEPYIELPPFLQPFPYSLFLYFSGAFDVEVFYRFIPITILLLIGARFKEGEYYNHFFWTGAVLTALREPLEQLPAGDVAFILYSLLSGFGMNFLQAIYLKKSGFLASLSVRLGHYLIWHILLGIYVQFLEIV